MMMLIDERLRGIRYGTGRGSTSVSGLSINLSSIFISKTSSSSHEPLLFGTSGQIGPSRLELHDPFKQFFLATTRSYLRQHRSSESWQRATLWPRLSPAHPKPK